jgi:hypothetical protein
MLRLFKLPSSSKKMTAPSSPLTASLQVPAFGIIDIPWPSDLPDSEIPNRSLQGSLDIDLPEGSCPVKIGTIKVIFQVIARLEQEGRKRRVIYELVDEILGSERVIHGFER